MNKQKYIKYKLLFGLEIVIKKIHTYVTENQTDKIQV